MAASGTLPQEVSSRKFPIGRSGVLTLTGYGIKVRMQSGHLEIEDGIGPERRKIRLARVGHGLKRLVLIGSDGFITLEALHWLAAQDVAFVMLERDGEVLCVTGPVRPSDAKLRRAQALAHPSGAALLIAKELISQKIVAQERVARHKLLDSAAADAIAEFRYELSTAESISMIRLIESQAARVYWSAWSTLPVNFPKNDLGRVPDHWRSFGARVSPLTGSPRLAANPPNAMLNYLYSILESEARLAAAALGLDPGLGVLHVDTTARDSLACDLMEPVRPQVDAYLLDWITRQPLRREWFFEQRDGNCRLMGSFAARLSETASTWERAVAPLAEWVVRTLWLTIPKHGNRSGPATPLTGDHRRAGRIGTHVRKVALPPEPPRVCKVCGVACKKVFCAPCGAAHSRVEFDKGRLVAQAPASRALRSVTQKAHVLANRAWKPSKEFAWLDRKAYVGKIQPHLPGIAISALQSALGISEPYASFIRSGSRIPHPRHWPTLARLVGVSAD
jgi:CRISPR-associated protein Cas1